ncbi:MAG: hypothetical protein AB7J28_01165 [Hyphomonadaceae bacterium]
MRALIAIATATALAACGQSQSSAPAAASAPTPSASLNLAQAGARLIEGETLVPVTFADGPLTQSGEAHGYATNVYAFHAPAGATLDVTLTSPSTMLYFDIRNATDGAIVYNSTMGDNADAWSGALAEGDYLVRPFLYRNAARRGDSAQYTIALTLR